MYLNMLSDCLKNQYGCKVYKLSLSSGCGCPNRDREGKNGCIFCDGAGAFAAAGPIPEQLAEARQRVARKLRGEAKYIAYFQSFTNTFAPASHLEPLFRQAMEPEDVVALSIATRPDCLGEDILDLLDSLNRIKPVWVELGLQTIDPQTAAFIRRGYPLSVYDRAVTALKQRGITVIVHQILGLPGEDEETMIDTARYIGASGADGIKFHLLHVLRGTELGEIWQQGGYQPMALPDYIRILERCVEVIPREMVIHRLTGDGAKRDLLAPLWSGDKKRVLNEINRAFRLDDIRQGSRCGIV